MAFMEQLMYGVDVSRGRSGRRVLGKSPGINRDIVSEVVRLCDNWGGLPDDAPRRPALFSFPLESRISGVDARIYTVVRISTDPAPFFHAIVLTEPDYAAFDLNPFALLQEKIFLDQAGMELVPERREICPSTLEPLVSPLPTRADLAVIEEALGQFLAGGKVLLPLSATSRESDRCLALLIASLPKSRRRELRFASFAASEVNRYTLAALYRDGATFDSWQRYLMATTGGQLSSQQVRYVDKVKECIVSGDLMALEGVSDESSLTGGGDGGRTRGRRPAPMAATIGPKRGQGPVRTVVPVGTLQRASAPASDRRPRPVRRTRVRRGGRHAPGWLAYLFVIALLAGGALYWLGHGGWERMPWRAQPDAKPEVAPSLLSVIDVGQLYQGALGRCLPAGGKTEAPGGVKRVREALTSLESSAAGELQEQARMFVGLAGEGIQQTRRPQREAERLSSLAQRGTVLESEMMRLELAHVSLADGIFWRDLDRLDRPAVQARHDSLSQAQPARLAEVATVFGWGRLLEDVRGSQRSVAGMARLADLLARERYTPDWPQSLERAAQGVVGRPPSLTTAAYRVSAGVLAQLKRAEAAAAVSDVALREDFTPTGWFTPGIVEALSLARGHVRKYGPEVVPPILLDVTRFYDLLRNAERVLSGGTAPEMSDLLKELDGNRVQSFDPASYRDLVDRLRLEACAACLASSHDPGSLPARFYPGGERELTLAMLRGRETGLDPAGWRELAAAAETPFCARWAEREARATELEAIRLAEAFDLGCNQLARLVSSLGQIASREENWSDLHRTLLGEVVTVAGDAPPSLLEDPVRRPWMLWLTDLADVLSRPLTLAVSAATIRFPQQTLPAPVEAVLELALPEGERTWRSAPFAIGPAAPAGSGWVGTAEPGWTLEIDPLAAVTVRLREKDTERLLLEVAYPGGLEHPLPAVLLRPRTTGDPGTEETGPAGAGSVAFRLAPATWRGLSLPAPPHPDL